MWHDKKGIPILEIVKPAKLISAIEEVCRLVKPSKGGDTWEPTVLSKAMAEAILSADSLFGSLPPIKVITRCPVLLERDGQLVLVAKYDRESGIYAGGQPVEEVSLQQAKELLAVTLCDFHFASAADRSRALAALITPTLVFGGLLPSRAPGTLVEADESQTGKGYLVKIIAAIYGDVPATALQNKKGVGSLEESFDAAILNGRSFISLDNLRGNVNSQKLESFLTEPDYPARIPYLAPVRLDASKTIVLLTSNRAQLTQDLTNRVSAIRLLIQPAGFVFTLYREGDLLKHVQSNQGLFLAAVFAIVKAWYAAGKPANEKADHDFREWCGSLDWIVTNLLSEAPLMQGHREIQCRTVSPGLTWLRDAAHAVDARQKLDEWLRPNSILDILRGVADIEIPGVQEGDDIEDENVRDRVFKAIGRRISECLGDEDEVEVDGYSVDRRTIPDEKYRERKEYRFRSIQPRKSPRSHPEVTPEEKPRNPEDPEGGDIPF